MNQTHLLYGIAAGLVAGAVFGVVGGLMGILPNIAALVGASSPVVGFVVNLGVSALVAIPFVLFFGRPSVETGTGVTYGLAYGAVWWVLGPLVLMPLILGAPSLPIFSAEAVLASWPKLLMHLLYGGLLGLVYAQLTSSAHEHVQPLRTHTQQTQ